MRMSLPTPPLPILQYSTVGSVCSSALLYTVQYGTSLPLLALKCTHHCRFDSLPSAIVQYGWYSPPLPSSLILVYQINNLNNLNNLNHRRTLFPVLHPMSQYPCPSLMLLCSKLFSSRSNSQRDGGSTNQFCCCCIFQSVLEFICVLKY